MTLMDRSFWKIEKKKSRFNHEDGLSTAGRSYENVNSAANQRLRQSIDNVRPESESFENHSSINQDHLTPSHSRSSSLTSNRSPHSPAKDFDLKDGLSPTRSVGNQRSPNKSKDENKASLNQRKDSVQRRHRGNGKSSTPEATPLEEQNDFSLNRSCHSQPGDVCETVGYGHHKPNMAKSTSAHSLPCCSDRSDSLHHDKSSTLNSSSSASAMWQSSKENYCGSSTKASDSKVSLTLPDMNSFDKQRKYSSSIRKKKRSPSWYNVSNDCSYEFQ